MGAIQEIGSRGTGFGVHLVVTSGRWADLRLPMQSIMGTKLELGLNDPLDSSISLKDVENIRSDTPGRCVRTDKLMTQICISAVSIGGTTYDLDDTVRAIAESWRGPAVSNVRMLPTSIDYTKCGPRDRTCRRYWSA